MVQAIITFMLVHVSGAASINLDSMPKLVCSDHQSLWNGHCWKAGTDIGHIIYLSYVSL